ncbi:MAG: citrulline utilization hydrolase CtlX [Chitinophagaceae bacterium]
MTNASTVLMVRPAAFGFNRETAQNNFFQTDPGWPMHEVQKKALAEFDSMVQVLQEEGINVLVIEDSVLPPKPDAIFPNNWLSTSPDGKIFIYPLFAPNRRPEKRDDILQLLADKYIVKDVQDWSEFEAEGRFLEGTGSMIMDHGNKLIYAAISERTNISVLEKFSASNGYQAMVFLATDREGRPVYHTNVVMSLGEQFCVLCEEAIDEEWELIAVRQLLESTGHVIIPISREQMHHFAGNMLELKTNRDENILVLSRSANDSLQNGQREMLEAFARLLPIEVGTIEAVEGGSVRCMMMEVFLEEK